MKKFTFITLATLATVWFTPNLSVAVVVIDFADSDEPVVLDVEPYTESGFLFSQLAGSGSSIFEELMVEDTVQITRIGGGLFDLLSLDVVFRSSLDELGTFDLVTSKGGTQSLDTVTSYTFSAAEFQGLSWANLVSVKSGLFADNNTVDNIALFVVPEPSTAALLIAGGTLAFALARRRNRKP